MGATKYILHSPRGGSSLVLVPKVAVNLDSASGSSTGSSLKGCTLPHGCSAAQQHQALAAGGALPGRFGGLVYYFSTLAVKTSLSLRGRQEVGVDATYGKYVICDS